AQCRADCSDRWSRNVHSVNGPRAHQTPGHDAFRLTCKAPQAAYRRSRMSRHPVHLDVETSHAGLIQVRQRIAQAASEAGRNVADITLVAVSKTFGAAAIEPVIAAGQRVFGENRVQECKAKWPELSARHPGVMLHLIGPLQSNKASEAVALFDCIQSLERAKLARETAAESP